MSGGGLPIEAFLLDPPMRLREEWGCTPLGQRFVTDGSGTTHVIDWVGSSHYPDVAGFIEEARLYGISRRIAKTADFAKLNRKSKLILVHSRVLGKLPPPVGKCPKDIASAACGEPGASGRHDRIAWLRMPSDWVGHRDMEICAASWWADLTEEGATTADGKAFAAPTRHTVGDQEREPGCFAVFPIHNITVIEDPEDPKTTADTMSLARRSQITVKRASE
jgi:hypothetical protein